MCPKAQSAAMAGTAPQVAENNKHGLETLSTQCADYQRMTDSLNWLAEHFDLQPDLAEIAAQAGLSTAHFQRLFTRWAGVSPKRFVQFLSLERAKECLLDSQNVLDAAFAAGLSGPGRLHDLFVHLESMSPGEFKLGGEGLELRYGWAASPFGHCFLMTTDRGICALEFVASAADEEPVQRHRQIYPNAAFVRDDEGMAALARRIFHTEPNPDQPLRLLVRGTHFQLKVWQALLKVPAGSVVSYADLADRAGMPRAVRAAASAVAANAVGYLIPCHRVIRGTGVLGQYRWGSERKLAMLSRERLSAAA